MSLFRKKQAVGRHSQMRRHLGLVDLIFLGIGSMVGTGIFTVTGLAAAQYAGPALIIS
ncbi:amino acid permease, partial [Streptococcus suis]